MGMPKGSRWKRLAVFSDDINQDTAPDISHLLWANQMEYEWWHRTIPAKLYGAGRSGPQQIGRDWHPRNEEWLMVRRGDWPMAFVLARTLGIYLEQERK